MTIVSIEEGCSSDEENENGNTEIWGFNLEIGKKN
jgi:hypothetical protein